MPLTVALESKIKRILDCKRFAMVTMSSAISWPLLVSEKLLKSQRLWSITSFFHDLPCTGAWVRLTYPVLFENLHPEFWDIWGYSTEWIALGHWHDGDPTSNRVPGGSIAWNSHSVKGWVIANVPFDFWVDFCFEGFRWCPLIKLSSCWNCLYNCLVS